MLVINKIRRDFSQKNDACITEKKAVYMRLIFRHIFANGIQILVWLFLHRVSWSNLFHPDSTHTYRDHRCPQQGRHSRRSGASRVGGQSIDRQNERTNSHVS